ncbi:NAD(P)H-binding protein [Streptomyces blattellae]|uniref:NAD(P)H-binding protein n=1 Tax=Streptomyces blattellae TaxID=2569855 RepID=UPI0012B8BF1D|nr:NAD(P)H-binding protein [Streptomyces blattellae]
MAFTDTDTYENRQLTLVTGGTGKTGRRVAERLAARGVETRIGSRSGAVPFDWHDPGTWEAALAGVDAAYLVYYPDLAAPGAAPAIRAFTEAAARSGVRRLVLLSGRGEEQTEPGERAVRESGLDWTIVSCSWFMQNFSEDFLLEPVLAGELMLPAGEVPEPFVDAEDIADVVVAALTEDGHAGRTYELTGPRALTFGEAAAEISEAAGREVRYVPVSSADYGEYLGRQLPAEYVPLFVDLFARVLDGRNARPQDGVQRAIGRAPRDFTSYAQAAADAWK